MLLVMEELVEDLFHALHVSANAERYYITLYYIILY